MQVLSFNNGFYYGTVVMIPGFFGGVFLKKCLDFKFHGYLNATSYRKYMSFFYSVYKFYVLCYMDQTHSPSA